MKGHALGLLSSLKVKQTFFGAGTRMFSSLQDQTLNQANKSLNWLFRQPRSSCQCPSSLCGLPVFLGCPDSQRKIVHCTNSKEGAVQELNMVVSQRSVNERDLGAGKIRIVGLNG